MNAAEILKVVRPVNFKNCIYHGNDSDNSTAYPITNNVFWQLRTKFSEVLAV